MLSDRLLDNSAQKHVYKHCYLCSSLCILQPLKIEEGNSLIHLSICFSYQTTTFHYILIGLFSIGHTKNDRIIITDSQVWGVRIFGDLWWQFCLWFTISHFSKDPIPFCILTLIHKQCTKHYKSLVIIVNHLCTNHILLNYPDLYWWNWGRHLSLSPYPMLIFSWIHNSPRRVFRQVFQNLLENCKKKKKFWKDWKHDLSEMYTLNLACPISPQRKISDMSNLQQRRKTWFHSDNFKHTAESYSGPLQLYFPFLFHLILSFF